MKDTPATFTSCRARLPVLVLRNPIADPFAVMVARRGQRIHNREPEAARRYEAAQLALRRETARKS